MKKLLLFPYHPDIKTLASYRDCLKDFQITGLVSYKEDHILIHSLNRELELEDVPYDEQMRNCDAVIILDNYRGYVPGKYYQVIEDAINQQKELLLTPLAQSQLNLENYRGKYRLLENLPDDMDAFEKEPAQLQKIKIYDIDVPIIGVFGQGKNCDKFETQLLVKAVLQEEYETVTISSNALGALFGCYTLPSFLFGPHQFQDKVVYFNHYIKKISQSGNFDVMVLGVPEGIAPFERQEYHHFAEYPLVFSSAISVDMVILCTYFVSGSNVESVVKSVAEYCQKRFNVPVGAIAISRTSLEIPDEICENIVFEYLDKPYLYENYPDFSHSNLPLINLVCRDDAKATILMSLRQLQENVSAI